MHVPDCCSLPAVVSWPALPAGLRLLRCQFDPSRLHDTDFQHCGLDEPQRLRTAAAKRRCEYLAGRLCAASAIAALGHSAVFPARSDEGAPLWPAGLCGSISHSHGAAFAVAGERSRWLGLGLDAEPLIAPARAARLAREILVAEELAQFSTLQAVDPQQAAYYLTLCFSFKESLFKALQPLVGQRFYFPAACLQSCDERGVARLLLRQDLGGEWQAGRLLDGYFTQCDEQLLTLIAIPAGA